MGHHVTWRALAPLLCATLIAAALSFSSIAPAQAKKGGGTCKPWSCSIGGGGGGGTPAPKPGGGSGSGGSGGSGGSTGGQLVSSVATGVIWFDENWYPGAPKNQVPSGASPIYFNKYGMCPGSTTKYGDWLGFSWTAVWLQRLNDDGFNDASTIANISYNCIRPPAYNDERVECVKSFEGSHSGPYRNPRVPTTSTGFSSTTAYGQRPGPRTCVEYFERYTGKPSEWGLWQLQLSMVYQTCTMRVYIEANAKTGKTPESELFDCGPDRKRTESIAMAAWCPNDTEDAGLSYSPGASVRDDMPRFWPSRVTFTANDCFQVSAPDVCAVGEAKQKTPQGIVIGHEGREKPVLVMANGDKHVFTWKRPDIRIYNHLDGKWAQLRNWSVKTSRFMIPGDASPRLDRDMYPGVALDDPVQPFTASPKLDRVHNEEENSISVAWREASQGTDGKWDLWGRWLTAGEVLMPIPQLKGFNTQTLQMDYKYTYEWQPAQVTCISPKATVRALRVVPVVK